MPIIFRLPASLPASYPSVETLLKSCKTQHQLHQIHARIIHKGLEQDQFLISLFLSVAPSLSPLSYFTSVFDRVLSPSTFLWNNLLKGYSEKSQFLQTLSFFVRMNRENVVPDKYTFPLVIKACSADFKVKEGKAVHGSAVRSGVDGDVYVGTSLIDFYGKCKEILCARKMFDGLYEKNVVSWTAMIVGYASVGDLAEARRVFDDMPLRNVASWNALIAGFVHIGDLISARMVFDETPEKNVVSYTTMIDGYAKAGDLVSARFLFDKAPDRDIVAWSALITGYSQNGHPNEAVNVFFEMISRNVKPDEFTMVSLMSACSRVGNLGLAKWMDSYMRRSSFDLGRAHVMAALIDMNAKCGNMDTAAKLFEEMPKREVVSYCSMMQGLSINSQEADAIILFNRMLSEGVTPDEVAFTVILTACSRGGFVEEGLHYFQSIKEFSIVPSPDHFACIVDLLSRSGRLKAAYELIMSMPVEPHAGAWGALLGACKLHGDTELGRVVADRLFELEPQNAANYVLLSNIYAAAERWLDVSQLRNKMKERGVRKVPGCSWIQFTTQVS